MTHAVDEQFMGRALELARLGRGFVSPNPMVGSVVVHEGLIIGEGWHRSYGEAHAEVNAIASVKDKSLLPNSTLYVTLEPCSHFGKTPPCADLLIEKKIMRVVVANEDSNPLVAGKGIQKLRASGIDVLTGVLDREARELNKRFFTFMEQKRPYIILKWAQTADGFIARKNFDSKWISNELSRQRVHQWRAEEDAILVGTNTAQHDDPALTVRSWAGKNPVRVVLDKSLRLPPSLKIFDGSVHTLVFNLKTNEIRNGVEYVKFEEKDLVNSLVHNLYQRKIQSVIVEGGAQVLRSFIEAGIWDEARVFQSTSRFEEGIPSPHLQGELLSEEKILDDTLRVYKNSATRANIS